MDALVDLESESPKPRGMRAEVQIMVFDNHAAEWFTQTFSFLF